MIELEQCTLCTNTSDPQWGLLDKDGNYWPLCDGCGPGKDGDVETAERCRMSGKKPSDWVPRFGFNETI